MNIVCLLGSPRKDGNSSTMAGKFTDTARDMGAEVTTYALNDLTLKGCQACFTCKKKLERCVLKDDLSEVLEAVRECDILVMATPVYYGDVSSQMKTFIDRTFSYLVPDYAFNPNKSRLPKGKKCLFVIAQGHPKDKLFADIYPRYEYFFKWSFDEVRLIRAVGVYNKGDVLEKEDILAQAEQAAREMVG